MYNAKTHGKRITTDGKYPSDDLITTGFHTVLLELAAIGALTFTQSATPPNSPTINQLWYKPDTGLALLDAPQADANFYRWDGTTWQIFTPTQFAEYIAIHASLTKLPPNGPGHLKNDGNGALSWDATGLNTLEIVGASGNIVLDGTFDVVDITATGNVVLNGMINWPKNKPMLVRLRQDGTGSRAFSLNATFFKVGAISFVPSTGANDIDIIGLVCRAANAVSELCLFNKGVD